MPQVRNIHATVVHGRDQRAQVASNRPPISAEIANANARTFLRNHVKHRRVRDHRRILEQGIQIAAVRRNGEQALKRIRVNNMNSRKPVLITASPKAPARPFPLADDC